MSPDTTSYKGDKDNLVWLHWDIEQNSMVISDKRNWFKGKDGPLEGVRPTPLPISLLTVIIGLLAQDGDAVYFAPRLLEKFIERGEINQQIIRKATQVLQQSPVVSPAKLVRVLEKDLQLLPVLWPMLIEGNYEKDLSKINYLPFDTAVWLSEFVELGNEYRCYIKKENNESHCIDMIQYRGKLVLPFYTDKIAEINDMISAYKDAPDSYAMDVALDRDGVLRLVEINDAYSIRNYGISPKAYALWLLTRWNQLII